MASSAAALARCSADALHRRRRRIRRRRRRIRRRHLLLYRRCGVDVGAFLASSSPPRARPPTSAGGTDVSPSSLRSLLIERLVGILLHPLRAVEPPLRHTWASMQAEVLYTLSAGMGAFFPARHAPAALLHVWNYHFTSAYC